jgi:hypothetical protein
LQGNLSGFRVNLSTVFSSGGRIYGHRLTDVSAL